MPSETPVHFLVGGRKGQSKRFYVRSRHKNYALAERNQSGDQIIIASHHYPDLGAYIQAHLCYGSTMKREFGLTEGWLKKFGGPDHEVKNPHHSSGAPARLYWLGRVWAQVLRALEGDLTKNQRERLLRVSVAIPVGVSKREGQVARDLERKEKEALRSLEREQREIGRYNQALLNRILGDLSGIPEYKSLLARLLENPSDVSLQDRVLRAHRRLGFSLFGVVPLVGNLPRGRQNLIHNICRDRMLSYENLVEKIRKTHRGVPPSTGLLRSAECEIIQDTLEHTYSFGGKEGYEEWVQKVKKQRDRDEEDREVKGVRFKTLPRSLDRLKAKARKRLGRGFSSEEDLVAYVTRVYVEGPVKRKSTGLYQRAVLDLLRRRYGLKIEFPQTS